MPTSILPNERLVSPQRQKLLNAAPLKSIEAQFKWALMDRDAAETQEESLI